MPENLFRTNQIRQGRADTQVCPYNQNQIANLICQLSRAIPPSSMEYAQGQKIFSPNKPD